ncbi:MAG: phosphoribosylglycinamide formyltransferase [Planctomycetes bacterium]|nr:phosphoribosylglycinamide formyltransferase [Planctomycetota bacterium]
MSASGLNPVREPLRLGALVSGGGRTVLNLAEHIRSRKLNASIEIVICSKASSPAIGRCRDAGLTVEVVTSQADIVVTVDEWIARLLRQHRCNLVCLCGLTRLWTIPPDFFGRVLNIHPSLLPAHGGRGMYAEHVHRSVLAAGDVLTGCTVHYADNEYDHGPILLQQTVAVVAGESAGVLADRVFQKECIAYPRAIEMLIEGSAPLPHPELARSD